MSRIRVVAEGGAAVASQTPAWRATATATAVTVAGVLPVFLAGGMAVQMTADLRFSVAALGVAMSAFVGSQAVLSQPLGRWADRVGSSRALRIAAGISAAAALGIAGLVQGWVGLAVGLAVAGVANALGQPSASRLLARTVPSTRQGLAFGIFQSAKPIAGLLAGLAVPAIALTIGWRAAFVISAVLSLAVVLGVPSDGPTSPAAAAAHRARLPRPVTVRLLVGMALGFGAAKVFSTFLVDAGVQAGFGPAAAGLLLAVGSGLAVVSRLAVGAIADRRGGEHLGAVELMLVIGALGFALLAPQRPLLMMVGTVLVAMGAWGYNGLFYLSMTRLLSESPAAITGVMLAGASVGGVIAPIVFGALVEQRSYPWGWTLIAVCTLLAAAAIRSAGRRLRAGEGSH